MQEPRGQGREDAHAQLTFCAAPHRVHDLRAFIDVSKNLLGFRQKPLSGNGQTYTAAVTVKQRRAESVFQVANPAADRGLLYAQRYARLAETPMLGSRHEIPQMSKIHTHTWKSSGEPPYPECLTKTLRGLPKRFPSVATKFVGAPRPYQRAPTGYHSTDFSMNPSVLAFSTSVRTLARSRPSGTSASISSRIFTWLPGNVVSCSTIASTI